MIYWRCFKVNKCWGGDRGVWLAGYFSLRIMTRSHYGDTGKREREREEKTGRIKGEGKGEMETREIECRVTRGR